MPIDPYFLDMPCGINDPQEGDVGAKFAELQEQLVLISDSSPTVTLIKAFLESYRNFYCQLSLEQREDYPPNMALGALFDLVVSAKYAERQVADGGWTYCAGDNLSDGSSLYFCYLQTCPRCSVRKGIKPKIASNKPSSDTIGEICGDVTYEILSEVIRVNAPGIKIGKNRDRQADVDFVFYDANVLALGETKSSPLVIYPLEVRLGKPLTEVRDGQRVSKRDHTQATVNIYQAEILMYISHQNLRINLGRATTNQWLYQSLIQYVQRPENVAVLIAAWKELYDVYAANLSRGQTDNRKWITCGCGGGVDDSKNKPGMDRTDDIKKGTYQSLKFGTYYKEKDSRRIVRSLIASNFFPLRTFERYLSEMTDVIWTKEKYSRTLSVTIPENFLTFSRNDLFYLYDAIICFTESIYMDDHLRTITSIDLYTNYLCL
ncbi:MAG: hypothetical protein AB4426_05785 [Xenococcaceae cyanobacterium]